MFFFVSNSSDTKNEKKNEIYQIKLKNKNSIELVAFRHRTSK